MTAVRHSSGDDTVYVACVDAGQVAYISDDSTQGGVSGLLNLWPGSQPISLATPGDPSTSADDTVYAFSFDDTSIGMIPVGATPGQTFDDSVFIDGFVSAMAVSHDDTVYVTFDDTSNLYDGDDSVGVIFPGFAGTSIDDSFGINTYAAGLTSYDDTLLSWGLSGGLAEVAAIGMRSQTLDDSENISAGALWTPSQLAVSDDTLFVVAMGPPGDDTAIWSVDPVTLAVDDSISLAISGRGLSSNPDGLIATTSYTEVQIVDGRAMESLGAVTLPGNPPYNEFSQEITQSGVVYAGNYNSKLIYRIVKVTPTLSLSSGAAGTNVTMTINPGPTDVSVDDTTVLSVSFGSQTVPGSSITLAARNQFTFAVPSGSGTQAVTANLNGGNTVSLGNWTYPADPPPPTPTFPPGAPSDVTATAGDSTATVTWKAPTSTGSFPITDYEVKGAPGGECVVKAPTLTCEITGLTNGTEYNFRVRALNGAGWGTYSTASNVVTPVGPEPPPSPSILIAGTRGDVGGKSGIIITGTTTGFGIGAILKPWFRFPGQPSYKEGVANILVDDEGKFTWQRKTNRKTYVTVRTPDGSVISNRVVISAR